ncbi:hypothetical protein ACLOJK_031265 [Asimina triloba]
MGKRWKGYWTPSSYGSLASSMCSSAGQIIRLTSGTLTLVPSSIIVVSGPLVAELLKGNIAPQWTEGKTKAAMAMKPFMVKEEANSPSKETRGRRRRSRGEKVQTLWEVEVVSLRTQKEEEENHRGLGACLRRGYLGKGHNVWAGEEEPTAALKAQDEARAKAAKAREASCQAGVLKVEQLRRRLSATEEAIVEASWVHEEVVVVWEAKAVAKEECASIFQKWSTIKEEKEMSASLNVSQSKATIVEEKSYNFEVVL